MNQLGSRDDAEDAMQSTFLNAHRAIQRGVTPEAELAWLFKIAHNVCLTRRRSTYRRGRVESPSDLGAVQDVLPAPSRDSADDLIRLTDALAHMPDNQRRAILLREWQGLSYHEIASELKLSQSAVETLIFRARRTLASNLQAAAEPERPGLLRRARRAIDAGTLLMAMKTLFEGGAAVKAAAAAVAVSGAAVVATSPPEPAPLPAKPAHASVEPGAGPLRSPATAPVVAATEPRAVVASPNAEPERRAQRPAPERPAAAAEPAEAVEPAAAPVEPASEPVPPPATPAPAAAPAAQAPAAAARPQKPAPPAAVKPARQRTGPPALPPGQVKKLAEPDPALAPAPAPVPPAPVAEAPQLAADEQGNGHGAANAPGQQKDKERGDKK